MRLFKTIGNIIDFWNNNHYTQEICVTALSDIIEQQGTLSSQELSAVRSVFESIINNTTLGENIVIDAIKVLEKVITDKEELAGIACILSGEYLTRDYTDVIKVFEYYDWSIPTMKNIFMCWYFKLMEMKDYYKRIIGYYTKYKLENSGRIVGAILSALTVPYLFITVICFMDKSMLNSLGSILVALVFFIILFAVMLLTIVFSNRILWSGLFQLTIGFKEYKL